MLSNLQVCFNAVMPLFLIMGLGYGVKCLGGIRVEDVPGLNKMAFRFFMPVMLFWKDRARFYSWLHRVWAKTSEQPVWMAQAEKASADFY